MKYLIILLISIQTFGQTKQIVFYNENGEEITEENFLNSRNYSRNLDLYFENDSIQYGLLIERQKFGQLDQKTFTELKTYLGQLSQTQIDSTQNIVVNYLTAFPKKEENTTSRSGWNVLDRDYLKKLHQIAPINQFWINSSQVDNFQYHHQNRINWITDNENLFNKLFFPYEVRYGNYILIKPDGKFYYYLGEHSKYQIWETAGKFFK